jgi:putative FmdB family regulatory protein
MPIYEYECQKCGYTFERVNFKKITMMSTECPNCNKLAKRIMSSGSFRIKGYSEKNGYSNEGGK